MKKDIVIGNNVYEKIDDLYGIQLATALRFLSEVDLKPLFHVIAAAMDGRNKDMAEIFKNGFLALSIQDLLAKSHLLFEMASIMIVKKGDKGKRIDDYDGYRSEIVQDLMWSPYDTTLELITFFFKSTKIQEKVSTIFSQVETVTEKE